MEEYNIETISKRSIQGIFALISRQLVLNILSFVASLVVFTFLTPHDVGIYTAIIAIQRIISFVTDFGFGAALIQKKEAIKREELKTIFTIQFTVTLSIFFVVLLSKGLISSYFKFSEEGSILLIVLVFTIFLSSFKSIPSLILEREIKFSKLVIPQIVEAFSFNILLIILLLQGKGISSYSFAFLFSSIIGIPFYYLVSPWQIGLGIDRNSLKHLRFGIQFQAKNILATLKDDFLTIFLVKILSFSQIGYIGFGQRNAFFVFRYVVDSVTKVTFSTYSRLQEHTEALKKAIEKSLFFVSSLMFPLLLGLIITAPYFIKYFPKWHNKWEPAVISLIFFSLNALVSSLSAILVNTLDATGRVKITLRLMVIWTILIWALTPVFIVLIGYNGVAIASFIVSLTIIYTIYLVKKIVDFEFLKSIYKPLICSVVMGSIVYIIASIFVNGLMSLILVILFGGIIYLSCLYFLTKKELKKDIRFIFAKA